MKVRRGQPRKLMDRVTGAFLADDFEALRELYDPPVIAPRPAVGSCAASTRSSTTSAPGPRRRQTCPQIATATYESGACAIDQGDMLGQNDAPLRWPDGQTVPATGRQVRVRSMDIATVHDGRIIRHESYLDHLEVLTQLGLPKAPAPTQP